LLRARKIKKERIVGEELAMGNQWDTTKENLKLALNIFFLSVWMLLGTVFSIAVLVAVFRMAGC
jgi:hypothetical protein